MHQKWIGPPVQQAAVQVSHRSRMESLVCYAGAFGLDGSLLTGRTLLNLDTEDWGEIFIGCAGEQLNSASFAGYTVQFSKLPCCFSHYTLGSAGLECPASTQPTSSPPDVLCANKLPYCCLGCRCRLYKLSDNYHSQQQYVRPLALSSNVAQAEETPYLSCQYS